MRTHLLSASSLNGTKVKNPKGEDLGELKELMIDIDTGRVAYAVLSYGGFLGMGDKLFAVPWGAFAVDTHNEQIVLDLPKEKLERAPGFDKDHWPTDDPNRGFITEVYTYYGQRPYWDMEAK